jgi:hypothetical protein
MALTLVWLFGMTRTEPLKRVMESTQLDAAKSNLSDNDSDESVSDYPQPEAIMRQSK